MESFLRLGTSPPFQNCKDSLIAGKNNSRSFLSNSNQSNSYQTHTGLFDTGMLSTGSTKLSNEVLYYNLYFDLIINIRL